MWWEHSPLTNVAWVRFRADAIYELSSLLALALLRRFFSGFSGFCPSTKTNYSKIQFHQDRGSAWKPARLLNCETYVGLLTFIIGVTKLYGSDSATLFSELNTIITFSSSRRSSHPSGQNSFLEAYNMARSVRCPPYSAPGVRCWSEPCSPGIYLTPSITDTTSNRSTFCRVITRSGRSL